MPRKPVIGKPRKQPYRGKKEKKKKEKKNAQKEHEPETPERRPPREQMTPAGVTRQVPRFQRVTSPGGRSNASLVSMRSAAEMIELPPGINETLLRQVAAITLEKEAQIPDDALLPPIDVANAVMATTGVTDLARINAHIQTLEFLRNDAQRYVDMAASHYEESWMQEAIGSWQNALCVFKKIDDQEGMAAMCGNIGSCLQASGEFHKSIKYLEAHLVLSRKLRDREGEDRAYKLLAHACERLGQPKRAIEYHRKRLEFAQERGHTLQSARIYGNLASAYQSMGNFEEAMACLKERLAIAVEVGDKTGEGRAYCNMGMCLEEMGRYEESVAFHLRHAALSREVGDTSAEGKAYGNLGTVYASQGKLSTAITYFQQRLDIAVRMGDESAEGRALGNLANAFDTTGEYDKAVEYYVRRVDVARRLGDRVGESRGLGNLGNTYATLGEFYKAMTMFRERVAIAKQLGDSSAEARALAGLADCELDRGCVAPGLTHALHCYDIMRDVKESDEALAWAEMRVARAHAQCRDYRRAIALLERAMKTCAHADDDTGVCRALNALGECYRGVGDLTRAMKMYDQQLDRAKSVDLVLEEASALMGIGATYMEREEHSMAIEVLRRAESVYSSASGANVDLCRVHALLGDVFREQRNAAQAAKQYELASKSINRAHANRALSKLGYVLEFLGKLDASLARLAQAAAVAEEVCDVVGQIHAYSGLASAHGSKGEWDKAQSYHHKYGELERKVLRARQEATGAAGAGGGAGGGGAGGEGGSSNAFAALAMLWSVDGTGVGASRRGHHRRTSSGGRDVTLQGEEKNVRYLERYLTMLEEKKDQEEQLRVRASLCDAYIALGHYGQALEQCEKQRALVDSVGTHVDRARVHLTMAKCFAHSNEYTRAIKYCEDALEVFTSSGDRQAEALVCRQLVDLHHKVQQYHKTVEYLERCFAIAHELGDTNAEGDAYGKLGRAYLQLGDQRKALRFFTKWLDLAKLSDNPTAQANAYLSMAMAYQGIGTKSDHRRAIDCALKSLKVVQRMQSFANRSVEGMVYAALAKSYELLEEYATAVKYYTHHLDIVREQGDRREECRARGRLGRACRRLGQFDESLTHCTKQVLLAKELGDKSEEARGYAGLGSAYDRLEQYDRAMDMYTTQLKLAKELDNRAELDRTPRASPRRGSAQYDSPRESRSALDYLERCLEKSMVSKDRHTEVSVRARLGSSYLFLGEFERSMSHFERLSQLANTLGMQKQECQALAGLGELYGMLENYSMAINQYSQQHRLALDIHDKLEQAHACRGIGQAHKAMGDLEKATRYLDMYLTLAQELGERDEEVEAYHLLGNAWLERGREGDSEQDTQHAVNSFEMMLETAQECNNRTLESAAYACLGDAYRTRKMYTKAIEVLTKHLNLEEQLGDQWAEGNAALLLGNVYREQSGTSESKETELRTSLLLYMRAQRAAQELEDRVMERVVCANVAEVLTQLGDMNGAVESWRRHLEIAKQLGDTREEERALQALQRVHRVLGEDERVALCERKLRALSTS